MSKLPSIQFDTSNVVAHIFYAAGHTENVVVTTEHGDFAGALAYPDKEAQVLITHVVRIPPLPSGAPICVEYSAPHDNYRFYTDVLFATPGLIVANLPYAVESNDRRLTHRLELPPDSGFYFALQNKKLGHLGQLPLHDISVGGLSFADPSDMGLYVGQVLVGDLVLPYEPQVPSSLEVRHLGLRRGHLLIGARFVSMSVRDRDRLARLFLRLAGRLSPS